MPLRPCLGLPGESCGALSNQSRCPRHRGHLTQAKRKRRPYTAGERDRRAAAVATWRERHGDWCPGWQATPHPATADNPLTADHPNPVAQGGSETAPLSVLCRRCNGRKSDRASSN